jgi:hypothetical protein
MSRLLHMTTSGADPRISIGIEGIDDAAVVSAIHHAIREVCRVVPFHGRIAIEVAPSDMRGRWDVAVKSYAGRHVASVSAPIARLPELVAEHVRHVLQRPQQID